MIKNTPVERFRAGRVTCALFDNEIEENGQSRHALQAVLARRYKDRWGYLKSEVEFSREDIPLAIHVLKRAFVRMTDRQIDDEINWAIERAASGTLPQNAKSPAA